MLIVKNVLLVVLLYYAHLRIAENKKSFLYLYPMRYDALATCYTPKCFCHLRAAWLLLGSIRSIYYGCLIIYGKRSSNTIFFHTISFIGWNLLLWRDMVPSIPAPGLPTHFILFPPIVFCNFLTFQWLWLPKMIKSVKYNTKV